MKKQNQSIPQSLVAELNDGNAFLFMGTGISAETGIPYDMELGKKLKKIHDVGLDKITKLPQLNQVIEAQTGRRKLESSIKKIVSSHQDQPVHIHRLAARAFKIKCIITTCWDTLFESAFKEIHRPYNLIVEDGSAADFSPGQTNIIKLYGTVDFPSTLVLTRKDHELYEKTHPHIADLMKMLIRTGTLMVLGWKAFDYTFVQLYSQSLFQLKNPRPAYLICENPQDSTLAAVNFQNIKTVNISPDAFLSEFTKATFHFGRRFEMEGLIGQGGMGKVYKAYDKNLNLMVALKILPDELANYDWATCALKREAEAASRLSHKYIIRLYNSDIEDGKGYISMEYIDGDTLEQTLSKEGPLAPAEAARLGMQICEGLDYAHCRGVVHRDIKPSNILLTHQRNIKITDFGIARIVKDTMTRVSRLAKAGTIAYMSPEQLLGKTVDGRSDIYSFGVMLYELLTGSLPFSTGDITYQHLHAVPDLPTVKNRDIPPQLVFVIMKCLEKKAEKRFQTAKEIVPLMQAFIGSDAGRSPFKPKHTPGIVNSDGNHPGMVYVAAGYFSAGDDELAAYLIQTKWDEWRLPQKAFKRIEYTDAFWIDTYPVTCGQYKKFTDATGHRVPYLDEERAQGYNWENGTFPLGQENHPVVLVSWNDAQAYAQWAGKRLPTELEWEKAARGIDSRKYPWGNEEPDHSRCNYGGHEAGTTPVDKYEQWKSPSGCVDMAGNVWNWCADPHPFEDKLKLMKGGSWDFSAVSTQCAFHDYVQAWEQWNHDGFRCVMDDRQ